MDSRIYNWMTGKFPQNYLLQHPGKGSLIFTIFVFAFIWLYQPLYFHGTNLLSFDQLMGAYCLAGGLTLFTCANLLKTIGYFSAKSEWTFIKEVIAIVLMLLGVGLGIFLASFILDPADANWSFSSLLNSLRNAYLIGCLPFLLFMVINIIHVTQQNQELNSTTTSNERIPAEEKICINSQLKKEVLEFFPSQFLYAESDGNYIAFYLDENNKIHKKVIRNSISQIEKQLSEQSNCIRTHRSFIINVEKVTKKQGNAAGYRLTLEGISQEVPVSRQHIKKFDQIFGKQEHHPA